MAGMIRGIFGIMPEDVRAQRDAADKALADANVARYDTAAEKFGAGFGSSFGSALSRGMLESMGIESPEEAKARKNAEMATQLSVDIRNASSREDFETIINNVVNLGGDTATLSQLRAMKNERFPKVEAAEIKNVTEAQMEARAPVMASILAENGFESANSDFSGSGYQQYFNAKVNQTQARQKTEAKRNPNFEMMDENTIIRNQIQQDINSGKISKGNDWLDFGAKEPEFNPNVAGGVTTGRDPKTGKLFYVRDGKVIGEVPQ